MNRGDFEKLRSPRWVHFDQILGQLENRKVWKREESDPAEVELPQLFREVCQDLALARERMYGSKICDYLNSLVMRGYKVIHGHRSNKWEGFQLYVTQTIPRAVRADGGLFWLCSFAFLIPYVVLWLSVKFDISWVHAVLGTEQMIGLEQMYGKQDTASFLRDEYGSNFMMFCFYIFNNVSIDFRIFAGGVFFGVGSLFFLLFNGIVIGASAGYVHYAGDPEKFYTFVVGHSSFELVGMVLSGMAGMKIGLSLLSPGRLRRRDAIAESGKKAIPLIVGGALLTTVAAVVEGFWSARDFAPGVKYLFGACAWTMVALYLIFCGRRSSGA